MTTGGTDDTSDKDDDNPDDSDASETLDSDGDGVGDNSDAFPNNASETMDTDGDGIGDNSDAFPDDASETLDSDGDGVGDNSDAFPDDATEIQDSDGDGVGDNSDAFPNNASETMDTDGDGIGDNSDAFPDDASETLDSDGDGTGDNADAFPNDASETLDTDGDGVGDNSDAFPNNASETMDTDGDGIGDNSDAFPDDASETLDSDGDGTGDNADAFPNDASETLDTDGDGVGDNSDVFPNNASETQDSDGDGVGDNSDAFPDDASETLDSDGDGTGDNADAFPNDVSETMDSDGDGVGDNSDAFPNDPSRTVNSLPFPLQAENPGSASWSSSRKVCTAGSDCRSHKFYWSAHMPHYGTSDLPMAPETEDAKHMPIYHDHRSANRKRLFVGVDQGNIGSLPQTGNYGVAEVRYGMLRDGAGRQDVLAYLLEVRQTPIWWNITPLVTYSGETEQDLVRLVRAVQLVNTTLPEDRKMRIASSSVAVNPEDGIYVEFLSEQIYEQKNPTETWGYTTTHWLGNIITKSHIEVNEAYALLPSEDSSSGLDSLFDFSAPVWGIDQVNRQGTVLLAHELLHALGIIGDNHVSDRFDSIMTGTAADYNPTIEQPLSLLYKVDREALRALYSAFEVGDSLTDFGPWADGALHVHGNSPHAGFGVALRNNYLEPWAYGYLPDSDLADNGNLSGNATWNGTLLGLTPDAGVVAGDARVAVNLNTMAGDADFTDLETWAANTAPSEKGSGTTWLDGDLGYIIDVRGNTFRETSASEDDGRLTGIFTGQSHEGAAGTLERSDLTAAFGAIR